MVIVVVRALVVVMVMENLINATEFGLQALRLRVGRGLLGLQGSGYWPVQGFGLWCFAFGCFAVVNLGIELA